MNTKRWIAYGALFCTIAIVGYHAYSVIEKRTELETAFAEVKASFDALQTENEAIESRMEYLSDPHNLEKEARSRFNYRAPDEKMMIIVPE